MAFFFEFMDFYISKCYYIMWQIYTIYTQSIKNKQRRRKMKKALYIAIVSMAFVVGMGFSNKLVFADEQVTTPQVTTVA